jgi:hypothetical protein
MMFGNVQAIEAGFIGFLNEVQPLVELPRQSTVRGALEVIE